jgi:hypothetical protein
MATNIVRAQAAAPVPSPQDGGWSWDGSNWVCDPNCPPSFPPFGPPVFSGPTQQPPWYPGANGGVSFGLAAPANPVRGHMWWDGTTFWLFDGAAWVSINSGSTGIKGVTDGSFAAPGMVGEVLRTTSPINMTITSTQVQSTTFSALVLSPGDWDMQALFFIVSITSGTLDYAFLQVQASAGGFAPGGLAGIWTQPPAGVTEMQVSTNVMQVNYNQPVLVTGTVTVASPAAGTVVQGQVIAAARRMR